MSPKPWIFPFFALATVVTVNGCVVPKVSLARLSQPARAGQLDAYSTFVGDWTWEAELVNAATEADRHWKGTANWQWTLDRRALRGTMSASCGDTSFKGEGIWSWHPKKKKYTWSMQTNWGYPQNGTARYSPECQCWCMDYKSVGLDGTASHGRYTMQVVDKDTLDWSMVEWDATRMVKKMELTGTYRRNR